MALYKSILLTYLLKVYERSVSCEHGHVVVMDSVFVKSY